MAKTDREPTSRSERKRKKSKKPRRRGIWKNILLGLLAFTLLIIVAGAGLFVYYAADAPEMTEDDLTGTYSSEFVDRNGNIFYTLGGVEREFATFEEYPEVVTNAFMAIEDQRFLDHIGIDPIGIGRAAVGLVVNQEIVGGGSTITQQLVKNAVFSTLEEDVTLKRKAQEAWLAIQLEQELSKDQIMTLYLNRIHMGGNVYGVATAAEEYYGKHISELELHEAAMLAGMPRAPNFYNPYNDPEVAKNRRDTVLYAMVDFGVIAESDAEAASQIPVTQGLQEPTPDEDTQVVEAYVTAVLDELSEKTEYDPATAGLTVYTNFDPEAQQLIYDVVNTDDYVTIENDNAQAAVTLMDSTTGQVSAIIGGRHQEGERLTNRAFQTTRPVASTIKPLTVYGPAIEFLQYSTYHQVYDEPYELNEDWDLNNYDNQFKGQMSMREALVDSRNIPTANLMNDDLENYHGQIIEFLDNLGIDIQTLTEGENQLQQQNAISGHMSPMHLTGAYGAFANNGNYTEPYTVSRIVTQRGEEIDLTPETNRVMEEYTAYMVNDMLKDVVTDQYTASLNIPGYIHAAKTGTSNFDDADLEQIGVTVPADGVPDNWVVGYSPYYTMAVWVGFDKINEQGNYFSLNAGEGSLARDIYRESMSRLISGFEQRDWARPESVVELDIEDGSDPAELAAPGSTNIVRELFVRDNIPTQRAEPEVLDLPAPSGLRARYMSNTDDVDVSWNAFEPDDEIDGTIEYVLSINGETQVTAGTEYLITDPPRGDLEISVAIRVGDQVGPSSSVTINIPEIEEEPEEEPENEEEPEEEPEEPVAPEEPTEPEEPIEPAEPDDGSGEAPPANEGETPPENPDGDGEDASQVSDDDTSSPDGSDG